MVREFERKIEEADAAKSLGEQGTGEEAPASASVACAGRGEGLARQEVLSTKRAPARARRRAARKGANPKARPPIKAASRRFRQDEKEGGRCWNAESGTENRKAKMKEWRERELSDCKGQAMSARPNSDSEKAIASGTGS